jgi:hypothetical protein
MACCPTAQKFEMSQGLVAALVGQIFVFNQNLLRSGQSFLVSIHKLSLMTLGFTGARCSFAGCFLHTFLALLITTIVI